MATAIGVLWRDLEYAIDMFISRTSGQEPTAGLVVEDDNQDSEESWTVIGNESDEGSRKTMKNGAVDSQRSDSYRRGLGRRDPRPTSKDGIESKLHLK